MSINILLISNLCPPYQIGGYEIAAYDVAKNLIKLGYQVTILTSDYLINRKSPVEDGVQRKLRLLQNWEGKQQNSTSSLEQQNYRVTKKLLQQLKPDVVYLWNQCFLGGGPMQAITESKIPLVHHLMGNDIISYLKVSWWYKWRYHQMKGDIYPTQFIQQRSIMDNSIFISRSLKAEFAKYGIWPLHGKVIYPGIEVDKIIRKTHYKLTTKKISIVYVGQVATHKGIEVLIQALTLIKIDPKLRVNLSIYGEGDSDQILELGRKFGVEVRLKGFATRSKLYSKLHTYDIGVFPSIWKEPFGISQIEMMAAGLPVVSSAQGGSGEAIQNQVTGLTFQSENPRNLALVLTDLINHYDQIAPNLGNKARMWVKANYSHKLAIKHICDMMVDVINYN